MEAERTGASKGTKMFASDIAKEVNIVRNLHEDLTTSTEIANLTDKNRRQFLLQ
jgi:hypothetical protein